MTRMKTILVDDEEMALEVLEKMLSPYDKVDIVGKYTDYNKALEEIEEKKPELVFLDIEMGEMNGLEVAGIIRNKLDNVEIVFVTAYSQYAVDAFEANAIDYLLKPIVPKRLGKAISRVKESVIYNKDEKSTNELKVNAFNGFQVLDSEGEEISWRTQKAKELFAYLWLRQGKTSTKDTIIENIFPDRDIDKASTMVHTTVYQLRKALKELGYGKGILYSQEGYRLKVPIGSDLEELLAIIKKDRYTSEDIGRILEIYKGNFLKEGYSWAVGLQQSYKHLVFKVLENFAKEELEKERFKPILKITLDKLYAMDSFNDSVIAMIIYYYGKQKETVSLEEFFEIYEEELWKEMNLNPSQKVIDTYNKYTQ